MLPFSFDRVVRAVERVKERLYRATAALEAGGVPYAVVGGNAVAAWISRVDESLVRNRRDVDILLRRADLEAAQEALAKAGFIYRHVKSLDVFLNGPDAKVGDALHIIFANENVTKDQLVPNPDVTDSIAAESYRVVSLEALVTIKLTAYHDKDRTHLRDMLDAGLIDASWVARLPVKLAERLQHLIDTPEG
jgi:hypothetical protein